MQALLHGMRPLLQAAEMTEARCPVEDDEAPLLTLGRAIIRTYREYTSPAADPPGPVVQTAHQLRQAYALVSPTYTGTGQHDANEFLHTALLAVEQVIALAPGARSLLDLCGVSASLQDTCRGCS